MNYFHFGKNDLFDMQHCKGHLSHRSIFHPPAGFSSETLHSDSYDAKPSTKLTSSATP